MPNEKTPRPSRVARWILTLLVPHALVACGGGAPSAAGAGGEAANMEGGGGSGPVGGSGGSGSGGDGAGGATGPATIRVLNHNETPAYGIRVLAFDDAGAVVASLSTDEAGDVEIETGITSFITAFNITPDEATDDPTEYEREALVLLVMPEPGETGTVGFSSTSNAARADSPPPPTMALSIHLAGLPAEVTTVRLNGPCSAETYPVAPPSATIVASEFTGCVGAATFDAFLVASAESPDGGAEPVAYHHIGESPFVAGTSSSIVADAWTPLQATTFDTLDIPASAIGAGANVQLVTPGGSRTHFDGGYDEMPGSSFQASIPLPKVPGEYITSRTVETDDGGFVQNIWRTDRSQTPPGGGSWSAVSLAGFEPPVIDPDEPITATWTLSHGAVGDAQTFRVYWSAIGADGKKYHPLTWTFHASAASVTELSFPDLPSEYSEWAPDAVTGAPDHQAFHCNLDDSSSPLDCLGAVADESLFSRPSTLVRASAP